jgi:hypothetical protein
LRKRRTCERRNVQISGQVNPLPHLNRRFNLDKRSELLIRTHNETLSVAAIRVSNWHNSRSKPT